MRSAAQLAFDPYERIEELEEEVRQLNELLAGDVEVLPYERMPPQCRRVLNCLMRRQSANREQLYHAAHGFQAESDPKGIDVLLTRVRHVLRPHGVEIMHLRAHVWSILPADKEKLRNA